VAADIDASGLRAAAGAPGSLEPGHDASVASTLTCRPQFSANKASAEGYLPSVRKCNRINPDEYLGGTSVKLNL
jgi:hypothetical protein